MNVLSLFDGMSCGKIALERTKLKVDKYFSSEIKPHAILVANLNFPEDEKYRLGDITKIQAKILPKIDLLIGGSPCQDLSFANKKIKGLNGNKSSLFYEYVRLLNQTKPTYFLLENVRMKPEFQQIITKELGVKPIKINSALVSPQLRTRLYWTNIPNVKQPLDKNILLNDVLTKGYSDKKKARALLESDSRPLKTPVKMVHRYYNTGFTTLIFKNKQHYLDVLEFFNKYLLGKTAKEINTLMSKINMNVLNGVRYMNNTEREACQTVPLGYTNKLSQNDSACLLGDAWTVDVIAHILNNIPI